jgi:excisionase family DNA binding protein
MKTKYMSVDEVANYLAIWPITIHTWVLKGRIPFIEVGNSIRIHADQVEHIRRRRFN